jgi:hypothetical protein
LQFVGGGLLDESEVNREPVQTPSAPIAAPAAQPEVKPNAYKGVVVDAKEIFDAARHKPGATLDAVQPPKVIETAEINNPAASEPSYAPAIEPTPKPSTVEQVNAILSQDAPTETVKPKRKYTRKSKNTVDLGDSATVPEKDTPVPNSVSVPVSPATAEPPVQQLTYVPTCPDCNDFMAADTRLDLYLCVKHGRVDTKMKPSVVQNAAPAPIQQPVPPTPVAPPPAPQSLLTPDQQKSVKTRLSTFWVYILPEQGGMTSDDGLSINAKLMKFADSHTPGVSHKDWNFEKWNEFISGIEAYNTTYGPKALVDHINASIGVV